MKFAWSPKKEQTNKQKHRVSFEETTTLWTDPLALIAPALEHSLREEREWIIGESYKGKLLVVVYNQRGETIRIISARLATKREREEYGESSLISIC
jgi:uncharacterized DUF497 family protein